MIHYHGTPLGGKRDDVARFFKNRHAFIPFPRPEDLPTVAEVARSFAVDNGAYSYWRTGTQVLDWSDYYAFVDEWRRHPGFDWAVIPDVIDGTEQDNDDLLAEWPYEECGVPVWHLHESLERLERLSVTYQRLAFGSSDQYADIIGEPEWLERMDDAMRVCCDEDGRPTTKLHLLRGLNPAVFTQYPVASADSTNVAQNASREADRIGCNIVTAREIIAGRIEPHNSIARYEFKPKQRRLAFVLSSAS